jgi:hypothetical protein
MIKYLGTHNSGTFSKLVGWQRPFGFILNATSQCQTLNIEEQIARNVRFFNLQITRYKNEWVFSHGVCIYTEKFSDALEVMKKNATTASPIYFQLILDNNFLLKPAKDEFKKLVHNLLEELDVTNVVMLFAYIENGKEPNEYVYKNQIEINQSEHYWSASWAKFNAKSWLDKLPLPKRHAKQHNQKYIDNNTADYLMLDFIEYGTYPITEKDMFININDTKIKLKNGKIGYMELSYKIGTVANPIVITYDYTVEPKSIFVTSKPNIIKTSLSTFYKTIEITPISAGTCVMYISAAYNDEIVESALTIKIKPIMSSPTEEPSNPPTIPVTAIPDNN